MNTTQSNRKYRPVLSPSAIAHIITLAKSESPISSDSLEVIAVLAPFMAKIENAGVVAAYTSVPQKSLEAKLGMDTSYTPNPDTAYLSKEEYWKKCYNLYISDPTSCSLQEIQAAREHMYLNDLMTEEEIKEFDRGW